MIRRAGMIPFHILLSIPILVLGALTFELGLETLFSTSAMAQEGQSGAHVDENLIFDRASRSVVRIEATRTDSPDNGSANAWRKEANGSGVVVDLNKVEGSTVLTIVTAYHVLENAQSLKVYGPDQATPIAIGDANTKCFADRSRELALVQVVLAAERPLPVKIDLEKTASVLSAKKEVTKGMAFGYSYTKSRPLDFRRVDFQGVSDARRLGLVRSINFRPGVGEINPKEMFFQLLGDQATLEGMSGGLVVGPTNQFAGLIYGRRSDQFNLAIPADQVRDVWHRSLKAAWKSMGEANGPLRGPTLFRGSNADELETEDRRDWGTFDGLSALLGDDPMKDVERFQEIVIIPPRRDRPYRDLMIFVGSDTYSNPSHDLEIWVNGEKKAIDGVTRTVRLKLEELAGETMVTVIKKNGPVDDFELGRLLLPSRVDLSFHYDDEPSFHHIVRSLPLVVQRFPLFITIARDAGTVPRPNPKKSPANARLAIRLDYAGKVLNQAPFSVRLSCPEPPNPGAADPILEKHKKEQEDAEYDGIFQLNRDTGWTLKRLSPQRLKLTLDGTIQLKKDTIRYRTLTVKPERGPDNIWPPTFKLSGQFQFPYEMPGIEPNKENRLGLALSVRATAASGSGAFRIKLVDGVPVDLAGIFRHMFTIWVNKRLIANDQPHRIDDEKITPFLERLGFALSKKEWTPEIRQAVFVTAPNGATEWLVLTFRIDPPAGVEAGAPPNEKDFDLLSPPESKDSPNRVLDLQAWGVPGALAERFPGVEPNNPAVTSVLKATRLRHLAVALDLDDNPSKWFEGLEPIKDLDLLGDNATGVADRILATLGHSVKRAKQIELKAAVEPGFVRDLLLAVFPRPDLKINVAPGKTFLNVVARHGTGGQKVAASLEGDPLELSTPAGRSVDLGDGNSIQGVQMKVNSLDIEARFDAASLKARAGVDLKASEIVLSGTPIGDASGKVEFDIDTARGSHEIGTAEVDAISFSLDGIVRININGKLPVKIDRDLNFRFDEKRLLGGH